MDNDALVPFGPNARLMVTFAGVQGDYPDPVDFNSTDGDVKQIVTEALRTGYIPGIPTNDEADIQDFVVDRFPATAELPPRLILRPKTPFGLSRCPVCGYWAFNGEECFDCGYRP
jgi:hypothetical protein